MTLIVGIWTENGVVLASDSAASYSTGQFTTTIGQQEVTKIHKLADSILFASTGAIGMAQLISQRLAEMWKKSELAGISSPEEMMLRISGQIDALVSPFLKSSNYLRPLGLDPGGSLCKCLVAIPVKQRAHLLSFDYNGAPERATGELPFMAMGSGQPIADPFLALLKRLFWSASPPTLPEARLAAVWTIDHVRRTNPGGVALRTQLAVLQSREGKLEAVLCPENDIQEHMQKIGDAEKALVEDVRGNRRGSAHTAAPPLPPPVPQAGNPDKTGVSGVN